MGIPILLSEAAMANCARTNMIATPLSIAGWQIGHRLLFRNGDEFAGICSWEQERDAFTLHVRHMSRAANRRESLLSNMKIAALNAYQSFHQDFIALLPPFATILLSGKFFASTRLASAARSFWPICS